MKLLIVYESKTGSARTCAELLAREFPFHDVSLADLADPAFVDGRSFPALDGVDFLVAGSSVRAGKLPKRFRRFLSEREAAIAALPHAFYICCWMTEDAPAYLRKNIPASLLADAAVTDTFGGEIRPDRCRGWEKLFTKIVRRSLETNDEIDNPSEVKPLPALQPEKISRFADLMKKHLAE